VKNLEIYTGVNMRRGILVISLGNEQKHLDKEQ